MEALVLLRSDIMFWSTREIFGNQLWRFFATGGVILLSIRLIKSFHLWIATLSTSNNPSASLIARSLTNIPRRIYWIPPLASCFYLLDFSGINSAFTSSIGIVVITRRTSKWLARFVTDMVALFADDDNYDETIVNALALIGQIILWIIAGLILIIVWGGQLTPLFASLGVGGIIIAFAIQQILKDMFASLSLFFDRPFRVGDTIKTGEFIGNVTKINIKSTRIKTLAGHELIIPNSDLTASRIENYANITKRRVENICYITPPINRSDFETIKKNMTDWCNHHDSIDLVRINIHALTKRGYELRIVYHTTAGSFDEHIDKKEEFIHKLNHLLTTYHLPLQHLLLPQQ
ncbi:MAG: mechanosensitive ion channel family protein [Candidatus Absconditabacterales bacterium]|nr:mechanosensitive ion channel family protein [Candidatus Absconditabacterales bacterium]